MDIFHLIYIIFYNYKKIEVIKSAKKKVGEIKRKKGHLYFVEKDGSVMETPMKWNKPKKKKKKK